MQLVDANQQNSQESLNADRAEVPATVRLSEIISALSYALDLTEGQPMGHSVRACMIGMRLAEQIGMSKEDQFRPLLCSAAKGCGLQQQRLPAFPHFERRRYSGQGRPEDDGLDARGLGKPALRADPRCHRHAFPAANAKAFPGCRNPTAGFLHAGQDSLRTRLLHRQTARIFRIRFGRHLQFG